MSNSPTYESWGLRPQVQQKTHKLAWRTDVLPEEKPLLPYGQGRSYGDVCLNENGTLVGTEHLNHFISFNETTGVLRCESGVTLAEILQFAVPKGWFFHVTPGTKFISAGGAIANDVHGKNHHRAGSFGAHVTQFELLRSDGSRLLCSPTENNDLFRATIGGLGLTGLITWAEFQLRKVESIHLDAENIKTTSLEETIRLIQDSLLNFEYVIASLDSAASGHRLGRSIVIRGNHMKQAPEHTKSDYYRPPKLTIPLTPPFTFLTPASIKVLSRMYYYRQLQKQKKSAIHYESFFYPQDAVGYWNRLYGKVGFLQYQCQVPSEGTTTTLRTLLEKITRAGFASPITTLKPLGERNTPAILSFPRPGFTLALDFPYTGEKLLKLFEELDDVVMQAGGALYPAKDSHMSPAMFRHSYPQVDEFKKHIDPSFSSSFYRRVNS